jgi:hypothetical protein
MNDAIRVVYERDTLEFEEVFYNFYLKHVGEPYNHHYRRSFETDTKVPYSVVKAALEHEDIKSLIKFNAFNTSVIRGLSHVDYETEDNGKGFENVEEHEDYLYYVFAIGVSKSNYGLCINYDSSNNHGLQITVTFPFETDREHAKKISTRLEEFFAPYKSDKNAKSKISLICAGRNGYYLRDIKVKSSEEFSLEDHYNDDFANVSEVILSNLESRKKTGIIFLHGEHGTGKTSYIRYLISSLTRNVMYMPPNLSDQISNPEFLRFLLDHKDSVLVLEDAENVIKTREAGENQAVSNLLNLTDGILGDGLNYQVICTFNTNIDKVDPALKRKGRMIANYRFGPLSIDKTKNLIHKLYGEGSIPHNFAKKMTLGDIFGFNIDNFAEKKKDDKEFIL